MRAPGSGPPFWGTQPMCGLRPHFWAGVRTCKRGVDGRRAVPTAKGARGGPPHRRGRGAPIVRAGRARLERDRGCCGGEHRSSQCLMAAVVPWGFSDDHQLVRRCVHGRRHGLQPRAQRAARRAWGGRHGTPTSLCCCVPTTSDGAGRWDAIELGREPGVQRRIDGGRQASSQALEPKPNHQKKWSSTWGGCWGSKLCPRGRRLRGEAALSPAARRQHPIPGRHGRPLLTAGPARTHTHGRPTQAKAPVPHTQARARVAAPPSPSSHACTPQQSTRQRPAHGAGPGPCGGGR